MDVAATLQSVNAFLRAMWQKPDLATPVYDLGLLLHEQGAIEGAIGCFERVAALEPGMGDVAQRLAAARAVRPPSSPSPEASLSVTVLIELARLSASRSRRLEGIDLLHRALALDPGSALAHANLGAIHTDLDQLDEAFASYSRAVELSPQLAEVHNNLGGVLVKLGRLDEGFASYRKALELQPDAPARHSNLVFYSHFHPGYDARAVLEEARAWDRRHGVRLAAGVAPHDNDPAPDRRLRIGYVSPDFRLHCQAFFLFPLLAHHDHRRFEIFCYSDVPRPDEWTRRLMGHADHARNIAGMTDDAVASGIRQDRIDVLVDLTMHMAKNRLPVFARKPAPLQVTWLAYPGTTGLSAMDYRVTDRFLDPPQSDDSVYVEKPLRLPETFWCYHPLTSEKVVSPLPARSNGHIRFGCLNSFFKVNDAVIALWARVLREIDGSRFVLQAPEGTARARALDAFAQHGVDACRIEFVPYQSRLPYLATYRGIDVCLDTFPYNGHTTSLDALWMGVPVVTLVGERVVGRAGLCQAMNLGLPGLIARTHGEYVEAAVALCGDIDALARLRAGLRARIEASPLMDAPRFAQNLEAAYRGIWLEWCARRGR